MTDFSAVKDSQPFELAAARLAAGGSRWPLMVTQCSLPGNRQQTIRWPVFCLSPLLFLLIKDSLSGRAALEGGRGRKLGLTSGRKSGYCRLEKRLGGGFRRVQTGRRAVGGGHKQLTGLTGPKGGGRWSPPQLQAQPLSFGARPYLPTSASSLWSEGWAPRAALPCPFAARSPGAHTHADAA